MQFLRIKNWDKFQHYRDRDPPWIKLHRELLEDYEFQRLQDASKLHLILIWLFASHHHGRIPNDAEFIHKRIGTASPPDLNYLISKGFLLLEHPDSKMLAECSSDKEAYTEEKDHSVAKATGASAPPEDPDPVFGVALRFLLRKGVKESNARSYLGLMRKKHGDVLVIEVATAAEQEDVSDPLGWMRKAMEARARGRQASKPTKLGRAIDSIRRTHDAVRSHQQGDADDADVLPAANAGS